MKARWVVVSALLLGEAWGGCGDETCLCDEVGAGGAAGFGAPPGLR